MGESFIDFFLKCYSKGSAKCYVYMHICICGLSMGVLTNHSGGWGWGIGGLEGSLPGGGGTKVRRDGMISDGDGMGWNLWWQVRG